LEVSDFDGDGMADLVGEDAHEELLLVARGLGGGRFSELESLAVPGGAEAMAVAPANGEERARLVVLQEAPSLTVLAVGPRGEFEVVGRMDLPTDEHGKPLDVGPLAVVDFDGDGLSDALIGTRERGVYLAKGNERRSFDTARRLLQIDEAYVSVQELAAEDLDGDGRRDLIVHRTNPERMEIYRGVRGAAVEESAVWRSGYQEMGFVVADFSGDGVPDIFTGRGDLYVGRGDATFADEDPPRFDVYGFDMAVDDFNGDGQPDVAIAGRDLKVLLSRGRPNPLPTPEPTLLPTATPTAITTATPTERSCTGDCDGNRDVGVSELVRCVGIALGGSIDVCPACDDDGDGSASIDELVRSTRNALDGCPE